MGSNDKNFNLTCLEPTLSRTTTERTVQSFGEHVIGLEELRTTTWVLVNCHWWCTRSCSHFWSCSWHWISLSRKPDPTCGGRFITCSVSLLTDEVDVATVWIELTVIRPNCQVNLCTPCSSLVRLACLHYVYSSLQKRSLFSMLPTFWLSLRDPLTSKSNSHRHFEVVSQVFLEVEVGPSRLPVTGFQLLAISATCSSLSHSDRPLSVMCFALCFDNCSAQGQPVSLHFMCPYLCFWWLKSDLDDIFCSHHVFLNSSSEKFQDQQNSCSFAGSSPLSVEFRHVRSTREEHVNNHNVVAERVVELFSGGSCRAQDPMWVGLVKITPQVTRFGDAKVCNNLGYRWNWRSQNTVRLQVHNWTTKSRRKELYTWYFVCVVKPSDKTHDTNDNVTTKTQSTFHTAHMNLNTWIYARVIPSAHSPVVRFWSSWFANHIGAQVQVVRVSHVIHACSERYSSTLSSPFHPTSSSPHSSSISCTSSTNLRAAVTLRIWPERRWTPLTSPTSPQFMSPRTTTSWRLMSSPLQSPWPSHSSPSNGSSRMWITMTPRLRRCFTTHTEYMSITPSEKACQSSSSVSEWTVRPVGERTGRLVVVSGQEVNVGNAQIRTLLNRQKSISSPNPCWLWPKKCTKFEWN